MQQQAKEISNIEQSSQDQLRKYLQHSETDSRLDYPCNSNRSDHPHRNNDDSKTERRSYCHKEIERSISSRSRTDYHSTYKAIANQNQSPKRENTDGMFLMTALRADNKKFKLKIASLQKALASQEASYSALAQQCRKDKNTLQEIAQLKLKLHQTETQLHAYLGQTQANVRSLEQAQKQWQAKMAQREAQFSAEKLKVIAVAEEKDRYAMLLKKEVRQLRALLEESQQIVDQLNDELTSKADRLLYYERQASAYEGQLAQTKKEVTKLQEQLEKMLAEDKWTRYSQKQNQHIRTQISKLTMTVEEQKHQINSLQIALNSKEGQIQQKDEQLTVLRGKHSSDLCKLEQLQAETQKLRARMARYEKQSMEQKLPRPIEKQIKTIELQLTQVKLQAEYETANRAKKLIEYERINELLNRKLQLLAQENLELSKQHLHNTLAHQDLEDAQYEVQRQLTVAKENLVLLEANNEALREEKEALERRVTQLEEAEQQLTDLRGQVQFGKRLLQDIEQREELRELELTNQIQLISSRLEENEQRSAALKHRIESLEQQNLQLQGQIQSLSYSLKNAECEIESSRAESRNYRPNNLDVEEVMRSLQRSESTSLSSVEELSSDNINLRLMLKENEQAIANLGRRYDGLLKGTVLSISRFYQILTQSKNIANQCVKHEKAEIADLLNDSLRFVADERKKQADIAHALEQQLLEQTSKHSEQLKVTSIKAQIIKKLEEELTSLNVQREGLLSKISFLEEEILRYQSVVKEKGSQIREARLNLQRVKKQREQETSSLEQIIKKKQAQVIILNEQAALATQRARQTERDLQQRHKKQQEELQLRVASAHEKASQLEASVKAEKQAHCLLRLRFNEKEQTILQLNKQQENLRLQVDKKNREIISLRVESDYRYKLITEKLGEITELKKNADRIEKEREGAESRRKTLEEGNKALAISRNSLEAQLKETKREIQKIKEQVKELQLAKVRLTKIKEDLLASKRSQDQAIRDLNQQAKSLKQQLIISEQRGAQIRSQKEMLQKDQAQTMDGLNKDSQNIPANYQNQGEAGQAQNLKRALKEGAQMAGDAKEGIFWFVDQLKKVIRANLVTKSVAMGVLRRKSHDGVISHAVAFSKELLSAVNKLKLSVLNRRNLDSEVKRVLLEEVKVVQATGDKISKCLTSDFY